jgi:hypothetical protein
LLRFCDTAPSCSSTHFRSRFNTLRGGQPDFGVWMNQYMILTHPIWDWVNYIWEGRRGRWSNSDGPSIPRIVSVTSDVSQGENA